MADIVIKSGYILTQDRKREIIENGAIAIQGNAIVALGNSSQIEKSHPGNKVIDARDKLVMPGFINAHVHLHSPLSRGLLDDIECVAWIERTFSRYYPLIDEELYYLNSLLCCLEMIKTGTTTFCDCGTIPGIEAAAVKAAQESGMRGVLGRSMMDIHEPPALTGIPDFRQETTRQALERGEEFLKRFAGKAAARLKGWLTIMQVPNASDQLCQGVRELSNSYGTGVMTHAAVTEAMVKLTLARFGLRDIERMGQLKLLGPNFLGAHAGWLDGKEMYLLKESGASLAHVPGSSMHGAYGSISRGRFPEMHAMGINLAIGCDGASCSNHFDMVRQLYLVATAHKEARLDPVLFKAQEVLDMASINGAKALGGEQEIGSLEPGKKADIVIFDLKQPGWVPFAKANLVSNLVYSATGESVDTVIIDGQIVMEGRQVKTLDEKKILNQAQEAFQRVLEKFTLKASA